MKTNNVFMYALLLAVSVFFISCEDNKDNSSGIYSNGVFIINEGGMTASSASVSFIDSKDSVSQDIFSKANDKIVLGSVLQSAYYYSNKIFLVVNNSNRIAVVNASTFKQEQQIEGLMQPRYMVDIYGRAYITQWDVDGKGKVKVVDLATYKVTKTIEVGTGPEGIVLANYKLWVANSGGFGSDSTISVIDPTTDAVVKTVKVADSPRKMVVDKDKNIWVLCSGAAIYDSNPPYALLKESSSMLVKITTSDYSVTKTIISAHVHPSQLDISYDKSKLYFGCNGNDGIYEVSASTPVVANKPLIAGYFYGFSVDPKTGEIYVCDAKDYKSAGEVTKYSATGVKIKSYTAGIIPNSVLFPQVINL